MQNYANAHISVDYVRHEVTSRDGEIKLTPTQWRLLTLFITNTGRALPNKLMRQCCLANDQVVHGTIKWHISVFRHKLGDFFLIKTIRGYGYRYDG